VSRILGKQLARAMNHVDPVVEGMCDLCHQLLQRPFLQAAAFIEAVVRHMAEIGFGLQHHRHVEEHAGLAEMMVGAEAAVHPGRRGHDRRWLLVEDALPIGARADVDRVLEHARNAAVVFGAAEEDAVGSRDLLAEAGPLLRRVGVEVLVVKGEVADLDHRTVEIVVAKSADRPCDLTVDASFAKAANDDCDAVGHGPSP